MENENLKNEQAKDNIVKPDVSSSEQPLWRVLEMLGEFRVQRRVKKSFFNWRKFKFIEEEIWSEVNQFGTTFFYGSHLVRIGRFKTLEEAKEKCEQFKRGAVAHYC